MKRYKAVLERCSNFMEQPKWTIQQWPSEPKDQNQTIEPTVFVERRRGDVLLDKESVEELMGILEYLEEEKDYLRALFILHRGRR